MTAHKNISFNPEESERKLRERFGTESPFEAPEGYFGSLPGQILDTCIQTGRKNMAGINTRCMYRRFAAAAAIIILAGSAIIFTLTRHEPSPDTGEGFSLMEIYRYNFSNLAELEEAYFMSFIGEDPGNNIFALPIDTTGITNQDIIDYLLAENHIEYLTINHK